MREPQHPLDIQNLAEIEEWGQYLHLDLISRQVVEGFITGLHRSPYHGFSVEFAEHRHYNAGESTRHIDWKLFARTDKLFVKRYEEETNLRAQIVIDTSSSMWFPTDGPKIRNKLFFSVYAAAALIRLLKKQRDAAGLTLFSDEIHLSTPSRLNAVHHQHLFNELTLLLQNAQQKQFKPFLNRSTQAARNLHHLAELFPKRSMVILFSDLFDDGAPEELYSALQHFRYNQHEVILFHVRDPKLELMLDLPSRPYRFVDMETGKTLRMNPSEIRDHYRSLVNQYFNEVKLRCGQYQIDFNEAGIDQDFREILLPFLIRRQRLF